MGLIPVLRVAAGLQLLIASANVPAVRMFRYRESMAAVPPHVAEVFWVQNVFIVLTVVAAAGLCFAFPGDLAGGNRLGRSLSGFLAVFWGVRLGFQLFFYDRAMRRRYRVFDVLFVIAFAYLVVVFTVTAATPGVLR